MESPAQAGSLNVDRVSVRGFGRFVDGFAQGRVRVDRGFDFVLGRFERHGEAEFGDQSRWLLRR